MQKIDTSDRSEAGMKKAMDEINKKFDADMARDDARKGQDDGKEKK